MKRYHEQTEESKPLCARCSMRWPCTDNETEDALEQAEQKLAAGRAAIIAGVHGEDHITLHGQPFTFEACRYGICERVRRAIGEVALQAGEHGG